MSKISSVVNLLLLCLFSGSLYANQALSIENAWIPEAPPGASVMAGFMTIKNDSDQSIDIVAISSPAFKSVEMHLSKEVNGIAKMLPQKKLTIPAKQQLVLKSGSYHLMLIKPVKRLTDGQSANLKFSLSNKKTLDIKIPVKRSVQKTMKCGAGKCGGGKCGGGR